MKLDIIPEPELEFASGTNVDIKFGLMLYGPLDAASALAPKQITVGIVGTPMTVEGVATWLERCRSEIAAKASRQPYLFPRFPGFSPDTKLQASLVVDSSLQRTISNRLFEDLRKRADVNQVVQSAVDLFMAEVMYLAQKPSVALIICAIPSVLLEIVQEKAEDRAAALPRGMPRYDLHDLLKAKAMPLRKPLQLVLPGTYDERQAGKQKRRSDQLRRLQDEATRAWNFHTALYYKAGGIPWRIIRDQAEYATCYVGVSFYQSLDQTRLLTSIAQVFNERGQGVVVRGEPAHVSKDDRQPHLQEEDAYQLLHDALNRYRDEHRHLPARIVVHKSSTYNDEERAGFTQAANDQRMDMLELVSLHDVSTRLFRTGIYPPARGTLLSLDERSHVLYTRGSVPFFETYPGDFVPRPLGIRCEVVEQTPRFHAQEILALTKMNWNNTQFDGADPISLRAARQVGSILKYIDERQPIAPLYSSYM